MRKIALFVDGANFYATAKNMGIDIDYAKLLDHFDEEDDTLLVRAAYYTAVRDGPQLNTLQPLLDFLDYNGWHVITKPTKEFEDSLGKRKIKGNMDMEMAVDMLKLAQHVDQMYLFTGDGDFRIVVEAVQEQGVRVSVISTINTDQPMIADELRRQADEFIDIVDLRHLKRER